MPTLRPFQTTDGHDVVNIFTYSGTLPAYKGTLVKIIGSGSVADQAPVAMFGTAGAAWSNTVTPRYVVPAKVTVAQSGDTAFGILLNDVRETDENGELLIFNPTKQAEMQAVLSGQAVPILTRGIIDYSGVLGTPAAGGTAYVADNGVITASTASTTCGKFLGVKNLKGIVRVKIDL